ncbi:HAD-IA family hydrolase [Aquabacterium sp. A7-Y]|uniref:HAD family hydrolase n=1 Tax=Aquabacterium sp. A7-Y TaxID=1349605 RepID=UPI00223E8E0C|nr:HAD-IA family hydrolase [Aquabacterium sp. A7-Y]MCW7537754.1 HAD-IA family hydrolase [Aquabacterium sp. A7-Y]
MLTPIYALTLDLDDTLWPIWPAIARAEVVLHQWLADHAPATAARFDTTALRGLRDAVAREHPEWRHDLSRIRQESLARALAEAGEDPALAVRAFEVFFEERQRVELFPDVETGLSRLAARFPLIALTNGNADLQRVGLARWFQGGVTARGFGIAKPDPRIFSEACRLAGAVPAQVLHVGDDLLLDVHGALGAGLQAAWMARPEVHPQPVEAPGGTRHVVADLNQLADCLGA